MGWQEKCGPFGIVNEDIGDLYVLFGSSAKTSDFIVDNLARWWEQQPRSYRDGIARLQIKADNGRESNGRRVQFLKRIVELSDRSGTPSQFPDYSPYHRNYNRVEWCRGGLEKHWNGAKPVDAQTMLERAKSMTWKGLHPVVEMNRQVYEKGVSVSKQAMRFVEARLERSSIPPKWDILIIPGKLV